MNLGSNSGFRQMRKALGLTQAELALRLGVDERTIRRAEAGPSVVPLWRFALDGLAVELWAEHLRRIGALTVAYAERREVKRLAWLARRGRRSKSTP